MKKYHVFAGDDYYPSGPGDYKKSFESREDAVSYGQNLKTDWWEIMRTLDDGSLTIC